VINAIRAHLAEFGIVAPVERTGIEELLEVVANPSDKRVLEVTRGCLAALGAQLRVFKVGILEFDRMINAWHRSSETSRPLDEIPGIGPALATALVASVADPKAFRSSASSSSSRPPGVLRCGVTRSSRCGKSGLLTVYDLDQRDRKKSHMSNDGLSPGGTAGIPRAHVA
jgi:transposase